MTRICILLIIISLLQLSDINSQQNCNVSNKIDLSTGLRQNNTQINIGEVDNYWKLVIIPPLQNGAQQHSSVEIPKLYRVPTLNAYWNVTGAAIVSPKNITNFTENNAFANQPWRIRRYFCIAKKGNYKLEGEYRCDDTGSLSLHKVEGTQISINNTGANGFNSGTQINHLLFLDQGTYYVEARILNTRGGHMGFSFNGSLTAQGNDLLSPQDNEACCPVGSINILKIIDKNCNGKYDKGDEIGVNWQFEVFKNNVKVGIITTNALGEGSLGGLTSGSYIVKELEKNGYYPYQSNYNQNITLLKNDSKQITFYNCIGRPSPPIYSPCCPPMVKTDIYPMFTPVFQGGASGPYTMKFTMPQSMKDGMQAYINLLKHTCKAKQLIINWQLCEVTAAGGCTNLETKAVIFTAGSKIPTIPSFFTTTLEQDKQYRITVIYKYDGEKCFDKTCDDPLVKPFEWDIDKKMGTIINKSN